MAGGAPLSIASTLAARLVGSTLPARRPHRSALAIDEQNGGHHHQEGGPGPLEPAPRRLGAGADEEHHANADGGAAHERVLEVDRVEVNPAFVKVEEERETSGDGEAGEDADEAA